MPNRRNLNMAVGDTVVCRTLRQGGNVQIYLPRAAVRYLGAAPGDSIYVVAGPGGLYISRNAAPTPGQASQIQQVGAQAVTNVQASAGSAANAAAAQLAALQEQLNALARTVGQPGNPSAQPAVSAADLQNEIRRYRRQR